MRLQYFATIITAFIETTFFAGLYLGWPSLEYVLEREGFFSDFCGSENQTNATVTSSVIVNSPPTCQYSRESFNLVFTIANFFAYASSFPLGYMLDRFGTWIFRSFLTVLFTLGAVMLAVSNPSSSALLYPSISLIALTGNALLISNLQVANLAKRFRGLILTFSNGLLTSTALVFYLVKKGYDSGIELYQMLLVFPLASLFLWFRTFALMPRKFVPFELPEADFRYGYQEWKRYKSSPNQLQITPVVANDENVEEAIETLEEKSIPVAEFAKQQPVTFLACLKRSLFWTNVFHFCVVTFRIGVVYGILQQWMKGFALPNEISKLTDDFGLMMLFAALVAPVNGIVFDAIVKRLSEKTKDSKAANLKATVITMLATSMFSILLSFTMVIFNPYGTFVFLLLVRSFAFGGNATFLAVNFPAQHLGKLVGLTYIIAGLVSLLQYPLFQLAFAVDPRFYYINVGILIATATTLIHPLLIFIDTKIRVTNQERKEAKARQK